MTKTITVDITDVQAAFKKRDYTVEQVACILTGLVSIWRVNDLIPDITREAVMSELEDDDLTASFLWNEVGASLTRTGQYVRDLSLKHIIIRWSVTPFAIMLEYEDAGQAR